MSDNDLNNAQAVTEQDLNNADVVNQQNLTDQVVQDQNQELLADGTPVDKTVPYSKLQEEARKRKEAEEQASFAQRQLELMQAQAAQAVQAPVQKAGSTYEQAMLDLGLTADDLYGENMIRVQNRKAQLDAAATQQQNTAMATQQFIATHPDVYQVAGSVNPATGQFVPSQELSALLAKKPHLSAACTSIEVVYDLVMQERRLNELSRAQEVVQEQQTRQNVDNITQPLGGSAAGGASGGTPQGQALMTREQVLEIEAGLRSG